MNGSVQFAARMTRATAVIAAAAALVAGCGIGPRAATHPAATTPTGALITIDHQTRGRIVGEILEARRDAILLLEQDRIVSVPFAAVRRAAFRLGSVNVRMGRSPSATQQERLRSASRYPYGLDPVHLRELLARYGQTEVEELGT